MKGIQHFPPQMHMLIRSVAIGIMLLTLGRFSATGQVPTERHVYFECENCTIEEALQRLASQQAFRVSYSVNMFEACSKLNIRMQRQRVDYFLNEILNCNGLTYKVFENQVVIYKRLRKVHLTGFVQDSATGERLLGAVIRVMPDGKQGATTNEFGFFSLTLEEGRHTLAVSFLGYETCEQNLTLSDDKHWQVQLTQKAMLPQVVISTRVAAADTMRFSAGRLEVPIEQLKTLPMPGGEADVLRLTALQTGVTTGVDGLGGLHVRGGNSDQNLVLLDDVPVFNPSHALGLLSIFNTNTVARVDFWKGNFPARYGGRASSVIDVRTRDGNQKKWGGKADIGLLASTLLLEGPVKKDTSSVLLAARFSYLDPWIRAFARRKNLITLPDDSRVVYQFYDANVKWSHTFSPRNRVYCSFYTGQDAFQDQFQQQSFYNHGTYEEQKSIQSDWGNTIASLRLNHVFHQQLFSNTTLTFSQYFYENRLAFASQFFRLNGKIELLSDVAQLYRTFIQDVSAQTDFTFYQNNQLTWRFGGNTIRHFFQPGAVSVDLLQPGQTPSALDSLKLLFLNDEKRLAWENEIYAEADWRLGATWQIMAGAHFSYFFTEKMRYPSLQPRLLVQKFFRRRHTVWAGYHLMTQNLHQIGSFNVSLPFELWVPSTRKVKPEQAWQASCGWSWQPAASGKWMVQVEGFWKNLNRVLTFLSAYDALFVGGAENASGWEDRIASGRGWSRGAELTIEKKQGWWRGSWAYTLSWAWRQFPELNSGKPFPFRFDRRHDLKILMECQLASHWSANVAWVFTSGNPITLTGVKFRHSSNDTPTSSTVLVYSEVNGYRLPHYHRLDVGLTFRRQGRTFAHLLHAGVYNLYNRANPFFITVDVGSSVRGRATQFSLLPILPTLRYEFSF